MKKVFLSVAVAALVGVGLTSCKKTSCIECTNSGVTSKVCEDDFNSANYGGQSWKTWSDLMATSPNCKKVK